MSLDFKTATDICTAVRRQFLTMTPEFSAIFILHKEDERGLAFKRDLPNIMDHPAGKDIVQYFEEHKDVLKENNTGLAGLVEYIYPGFLGFHRYHSICPVIFINTDRTLSEEFLRNNTISLMWQAIALLEDSYDTKSHEGYSKKNEAPRYKKFHKFIVPVLTEDQECRRNFTSDIFAASYQFILGDDEAVNSVAGQRVKETLSRIYGFKAENYPFLVCADTLLQVLKKRSSTDNIKKGKKIRQAIAVTREINSAYQEENTLNNWKAFSQPAQHMAWCGFRPEITLGCALYTSDNTYIRSLADMAAEYARITPDLVINYNDFNAFSTFEENFIQHTSIAKTIFNEILDNIDSREEYLYMLKEAARQNQRLMQGNPMGWSGLALTHAADTLEQSDIPALSPERKTFAKSEFETILETFSFKTIEYFTQFIYKRRREKKTISEKTLVQLSQKHEMFSMITRSIIALNDRKSEFEGAKDFVRASENA